MAERKGIMLCYPFDDNRLKKWNSPVIVQPKLDGERCRAICNHGSVKLLSSSGAEIVSVPHINEELSRMFMNSKLIELDGELYTHGMSFEDISSRVSRTVNIHEDYKDIYYHVFDVVNNLPQWERTLGLKLMMENSPEHIVRVPEKVGENLDDVMEIYDFILSQGFEGIIVRNFHGPYVRKRSTDIMKFKPKKDDYYKIVGWRQMIDKNGRSKEMLGALILTSDEGTMFSVGSGMNDEFRSKYWPPEKADKLLDKICHIQYQHLTDKRVPRFPVFVEIIDPLKIGE
jgi:ATP-dependent DNA ligase